MTKAQRRITWGFLFVGGIILIAVLGPWVYSVDPFEMRLPLSLRPPNFSHFFGYDQNGRDIFARMLFGARVSLTVAAGVVCCSLIIGLLMGTVAAMSEGLVSLLVVQFIDVVMAFPGFLLVLSLVAVVGPGIDTLIFMMSLTSWAATARIVRANILSLKTQEFVQATRALGASEVRVVVQHIWPQLIGLLLAQASFVAAGAVLTESSLSFLGLGVPAAYPTWGALLSVGRKFLVEAPHLCLFPGLALLILVYGFNLLGDGLRDYFDVKTRGNS